MESRDQERDPKFNTAFLLSKPFIGGIGKFVRFLVAEGVRLALGGGFLFLPYPIPYLASLVIPASNPPLCVATAL